jgi:death on curing protein
MAAAYLFHIAQNHAFTDGNKRVAATVLVKFLESNRIDLIIPPKDFEDLTRGIAESKIKDIQEIAKIIEKNCRELPY